MKQKICIAISLLFPGLVVIGQAKHNLSFSLGYSQAAVSSFLGQEYTNNVILDGGSSTVGQRKSTQLEGLDFSGSYQFSKGFSIKADVAGYVGGGTSDVPGAVFVDGSVANPTYVLVVPGTTSHNSRKLFDFMAGMEYHNPNPKSKANFFAHLMVGPGIERLNYTGLANTPHLIIWDNKTTVTNIGWGVDLGGGLDLTLNNKFDLRILQIDYNPLFPQQQRVLSVGDVRGPLSSMQKNLYADQDETVDTKRQDNFRFGISMVYKCKW